MEFYNYLQSFKCYSDLTCKIYYKYALELNELNNDYFMLLNKYKNTSNNTKRVIISAIKKYYEFIDDNRMHQLKLPKKDIKVQDHISFNDYEKIIKFFKETNKRNSFNNILLIKILFETGIRSCELLNIKKDDIKNNVIVINGKNKKQRVVYLNSELNKMVHKKLNEQNSDYLFNFSYKNLYKKISKIGLKVLNRKISPHMFRRGFATHCSLNNIDIFDICTLMGHENINTTKMYIKKEVSPNFFNLFEK